MARLVLVLAGCSSQSGQPVATSVLVPQWQEVADGLEASNQCCYTPDDLPDDPNLGVPDQHLPVARVLAEGLLEITTAEPHEMTPEHWITTMYVRDQADVVIGFRDFGATELKPQFSRNYVPSLVFPLPAGTTRVRAFAFCNRHSHWASDAMRL